MEMVRWTECYITGEAMKLGYPCKCHGYQYRRRIARDIKRQRGNRLLSKY